MSTTQLYSASIATPIGEMRAVFDDDYLYLLGFSDCDKLKGQIVKLQDVYGCGVPPAGRTTVLGCLERELSAYFKGNLKDFTVQIKLSGSDFQKQVWQQLLKVPYGQTVSYKQQAVNMGRKKAIRAVANANGANLISIIVPCHRVIRSGGAIGGYGGGPARKQWLLDLEHNHLTCS